MYQKWVEPEALRAVRAAGWGGLVVVCSWRVLCVCVCVLGGGGIT